MRVRTSGVSFFISSDKGKARIESIENDENGSQIFNYIITFKVDARNIIEGGATAAKVFIRDKTVQETFGLFDGVDGSKSGEVIDAVFNATARNKRKIGINANMGVMIRRTADLTTIVSNAVASNLSLFSDDEAFGSKRDTSLRTPLDVEEPADFPALQRDLSVNFDLVNGGDFELDTDSVLSIGDREFSRSYKIALNNERDPGSLVKPKKIVTTLMHAVEGTLPVRKRGVDNFFIDQLSTFISKQFIGGYENRKTLADYSTRETVPIMTVTTNRIKDVDVKISLTQKQVWNSAMLNVAVDIQDAKGVVQETKKFLIKASLVEKDFTITDNDPTLSIGNTTKGNYVLRTSTNDLNATGLIVFVREVPETSSLLESKFKQVITFLDPSPSKGGKVSRPVVPALRRVAYDRGGDNRKTFSIFRVVQTLPGGLILGNFSSATIPHGVYTNYHCVIYTTSTPSGIDITVSRLPANVVRLEILRKDKAVNPKKYESIYVSDEIEPRGLMNLLHPSISVTSNEIAATDFLVERDHIYEYRCKLIYKNGLTKLSSTSRTQKYVPPTGLSTVEIVNVTTDSARETETGIIKFDVVGQQIDTATDILVQAIQQAGLSELFQDDVSKIKDSIKNVVVFSIERFDQLTGETVDLGVFAAGTVTDGHPMLGPKKGRKYTYRAHALFRSPLELIEEIRTSFAEAVMPESAKDDPAARLARSSPDQLDPNFSDKFYSRSSFRRGTLSYGAAIGSMTTAQERFEKDPTGDTVSVSVDLESSAPTVTDVLTRHINDKGVLVGWSVSGQSGLIDFFAVASVRPDGVFIAGTCHNVNSKGSYTFIDRSIKGYEGSVSYQVTPVLLNGSLGETGMSGPIILSRREYNGT